MEDTNLHAKPRNELAIKLAWLNGVLVNPRDAIKHRTLIYLCPLCDNRVVLRKGLVRRPHFAHKVRQIKPPNKDDQTKDDQTKDDPNKDDPNKDDPNKDDQKKQDEPPECLMVQMARNNKKESLDHLLAKLRIKHASSLLCQKLCKSCGHQREAQLFRVLEACTEKCLYVGEKKYFVDVFLKVVQEESLPGSIPTDLVVEVFQTHAIKEKFDALTASNFNVYELGADTILSSKDLSDVLTDTTTWECQTCCQKSLDLAQQRQAEHDARLASLALYTQQQDAFKLQQNAFKLQQDAFKQQQQQQQQQHNANLSAQSTSLDTFYHQETSGTTHGRSFASSLASNLASRLAPSSPRDSEYPSSIREPYGATFGDFDDDDGDDDDDDYDDYVRVKFKLLKSIKAEIVISSEKIMKEWQTNLQDCKVNKHTPWPYLVKYENMKLDIPFDKKDYAKRRYNSAKYVLAFEDKAWWPYNTEEGCIETRFGRPENFGAWYEFSFMQRVYFKPDKYSFKQAKQAGMMSHLVGSTWHNYFRGVNAAELARKYGKQCCRVNLCIPFREKDKAKALQQVFWDEHLRTWYSCCCMTWVCKRYAYGFPHV
jgi:hypothetical protein